ncbi:hypothetical protein TspCOW1_21630 [Thiohalobacter sp. COW1]|uniref:MbcA/ParS/Xre antitoxin family protein n=1 Tax=Thiohalobacter sp. COW1 TaxID=2795687 RepID=UPI0019152E19|nr:MbcA/ParS/Xre antitoxin family protein [Thiohalobacter sp. COW1]BCO32060.1 hypothetical protein TspCOW1_21630 [Thiohalobacter sp. COW1]
MSVDSVLANAIEVLGDREAAERWMSTPKPALDWKTPLQHVEQGEEGERQVLDLLGALEHGVFS